MRLGASQDVGASGLVQQEASRGQSIQTLRRMRREARDEISRLTAFLDQSDEYVMTELEDDDDREPWATTNPRLALSTA